MASTFLPGLLEGAIRNKRKKNRVRNIKSTTRILIDLNRIPAMLEVVREGSWKHLVVGAQRPSSKIALAVNHCAKNLEIPGISGQIHAP